MTKRSVSTATIQIERTFNVPPARVFAAYSDPALKSRWFVGPGDWIVDEHALDFRTGGYEINRGHPIGGESHLYNAHFYDIVPNERIIVGYDMQIGGTRISVSLSTTEFKTDGASGTRMRFTENAAFLDGYDDGGSREKGCADLLDALGRFLEQEPAVV